MNPHDDPNEPTTDPNAPNGGGQVNTEHPPAEGASTPAVESHPLSTENRAQSPPPVPPPPVVKATPVVTAAPMVNTPPVVNTPPSLRQRVMSVNPRTWLFAVGGLQLLTLLAVGLVAALAANSRPDLRPLTNELSAARGELADVREDQKQSRTVQLSDEQVKAIAGSIDASRGEWEKRVDSNLTNLETSGKTLSTKAEKLEKASDALQTSSKTIATTLEMKLTLPADLSGFKPLIDEAVKKAATEAATRAAAEAATKAADEAAKKAVAAADKASADRTEKAINEAVGKVNEGTEAKLLKLKTENLAEIAKRLAASEEATRQLADRVARMKDSTTTPQDVAVVLFHSAALNVKPMVKPLEEVVRAEHRRTPGVRYAALVANQGKVQKSVLAFDADMPLQFEPPADAEKEVEERANGLDVIGLFPTPAAKTAQPARRVVLVMSELAEPPTGKEVEGWKGVTADVVLVYKGEDPSAKQFVAWAKFCQAHGGAAVPVSVKDAPNVKPLFARLLSPK